MESSKDIDNHLDLKEWVLYSWRGNCSVAKHEAAPELDKNESTSGRNLQGV